MANYHPLMVAKFGYMKFISPEHDVIDEDFDDLPTPPLQLIDIQQDIPNAS